MVVGELPTTALVQRRRNFQQMDTAAFAALQASMEANGVKSFVLVAPVADQPGVYEVLDGHHRWDAAERLGLKTLPVVLWDGKGDPDQRDLAMLSFNVRATPVAAEHAGFLRELASRIDVGTLALHTAIDARFLEELRVTPLERDDSRPVGDEGGDARVGPDRSRGGPTAVLLPSTADVRALLDAAQARFGVETDADAVLAALRATTAHNVSSRVLPEETQEDAGDE